MERDYARKLEKVYGKKKKNGKYVNPSNTILTPNGVIGAPTPLQIERYLQKQAGLNAGLNKDSK